jgi:hypothetical protein
MALNPIPVKQLKATTTIATPGVDTFVPTEQAVREAIDTAEANTFRQVVFTRFISPMLESLTWAAAQIFQAAITFQSTISQAVTSAGAGATFNQSGTGDIAAFQDAGVSTVRVLDQGGIALVPQAGGFQSVDGLLGYDSVIKRLVLKHPSHNYPVPIDPRNPCRNIRFDITYA